jgi:purine catabolism regulator
LHPEWKGLATTLDEAFDASRVAEGLASSGYFLRVDDLRADQLMLAWTRGDAFGPAAASLLSPLLQRDQSLIRTLSAYLDNGAAVQSTAEQLGVHRNTVTSHVQRIQALLNVDLRDPDTRLSLQLACRAVKQRMKPDA